MTRGAPSLPPLLSSIHAMQLLKNSHGSHCRLFRTKLTLPQSPKTESLSHARVRGERQGIVRGERQGKHCLNTEHLKTRVLLSKTSHLACAVAARLRSPTRSRDSACEPLLVTVIHKGQPCPNSSHSQRATLKHKNNIQVH